MNEAGGEQIESLVDVFVVGNVSVEVVRLHAGMYVIATCAWLTVQPASYPY